MVDETSRLIVADGVDPTLPIPPVLDAATDVGDGGGTSGGVNLNVAEAAMQQFARESSERLATLRAKAIEATLNGAAGSPAVPAILLGGGSELRDAWGRPIALLPRQLPSVGIAPDDGPFFVSAGPDGAFLTLSDNLYSYDLPALLPRVAGGATTRRTSIGGQGE